MWIIREESRVERAAEPQRADEAPPREFESCRCTRQPSSSAYACALPTMDSVSPKNSWSMMSTCSGFPVGDSEGRATAARMLSPSERGMAVFVSASRSAVVCSAVGGSNRW